MPRNPKPRQVEARIVSFAEEPTPNSVIVIFELRCELPRFMLKRWVLCKINWRQFIDIMKERL